LMPGPPGCCIMLHTGQHKWILSDSYKNSHLNVGSRIPRTSFRLRTSFTDIASGICVPTDSAKAEPPHYYGGLVNCAV
jgi:hypothetical protein